MKKHFNIEFNKSKAGKEYTISGWVNKRRDMGGVIFVDLRDRSGILQVVFNRDQLKDDFKFAEDLKNEYCISVKGVLQKRDINEINENIKTGEVELIAKTLTILNKSEELPFNVYEDKEVNEQISLKYRYLALRKEKLRDKLILRHRITKSFRSYLDNNNFIDIETPILCKSTPEGARDYLVPSRITKGTFYALPQSPQLFKQLLMISGLEKYYQIAKCFRDEDLRSDRQPEFTQVDIEMSFINKEDVLNMSEDLIKHVLKESINKEISYKFPRITYKEAMDNYGSDKPDTRFGLKLKNLTSILKGTQMNVFSNEIEKGGIAKCIILNNSPYTRSEIDKLIDYVKIYGARGMAWLKYAEDEFSGVIAKNLEKEKLEEIKKDYNIQNGDMIFIIVGNEKMVNTSLGALRLKIAKDLNLIDKDLFSFLFVTDFPMFEYNSETKKHVATHHPFTMPKDIDMLDDKDNCLSLGYDLVLNGHEIAGGSIRIHNEKVQSKVFKALKIDETEQKEKFGFLLDALKYGTPPHGGIAFGLDRIVMLLSKTTDIKDVIAFPKTQSASDLLTKAPSIVSENQLEELGIKIKKDDIDGN